VVIITIQLFNSPVTIIITLHITINQSIYQAWDVFEKKNWKSGKKFAEQGEAHATGGVGETIWVCAFLGQSKTTKVGIKRNFCQNVFSTQFDHSPTSKK